MDAQATYRGITSEGGKLWVDWDTERHDYVLRVQPSALGRKWADEIKPNRLPLMVMALYAECDERLKVCEGYEQAGQMHTEPYLTALQDYGVALRRYEVHDTAWQEQQAKEQAVAKPAQEALL
jgi:hypothetical protein